MKNFTFYILLIALFFPVFLLTEACSNGSSYVGSERVIFNEGWEFRIDPTNANTPSQLEESGTSQAWTMVDLPHTPRIEPLIVNEQWQGVCWYRKNIAFKKEWVDQKVWLRFEGAMNVAELWVNDSLVGVHANGYLPFAMDISDYLIQGIDNKIYVKLNNEDNPITGPKPLKILDFNMFGGLYRDVWLITKQNIFISDEEIANIPGGGGIFAHFPEVSDSLAKVEVRTHVVNESNKTRRIQVNVILLKDRKVVAKDERKLVIPSMSSAVSANILTLENPSLWSPGSPSLYNLKVEVYENSKLIDTEYERIGIRTFKFSGHKLLINGKEQFLRGVNRHQEYPYIGYALSNNANYRDALKIKEAGFDYIRLSHYPQTEAFLDACDELGIITINPILGWQYYNADPKFRKQMYDDARSLIRRDRNHACVLAWELSLNESRMPQDFIDSLIMTGKEEYPYEPFYTAGWLKYGYDIYLQARQHRIGHSNNISDKPYVVSEYGDWEYYAMNAGLQQDAWGDLLSEERNSRQLLEYSDKRLLQQATNVQEAHNDNYNTPAFADGYWVMFDYNRGYADDLEASGLMSIFREAKFSYYFFKSQRDPQEKILGKEVGAFVYIASRMMDLKPEEIRIYSNCETVELVINGESMGEQDADTDRISGNLKHPPFTFINPGKKIVELTAIGRINGEVKDQQTIYLPGDPGTIELEVDYSGRSLSAGQNDAVFVYARIVDSKGQLHTGYDGEISFSIEGDATIIGPEVVEVKSGRAAILLKGGRTMGTLLLEAKAENLPASRLEIEVK